MSEKLTSLENASRKAIPNFDSHKATGGGKSVPENNKPSSSSSSESAGNAGDLYAQLSEKIRSETAPDLNAIDGDGEGDGSNSDPLTVSVTFFVKWEYTLAFERWCEELAKLMASFAGEITFCYLFL